MRGVLLARWYRLALPRPLKPLILATGLLRWDAVMAPNRLKPDSDSGPHIPHRTWLFAFWTAALCEASAACASITSAVGSFADRAALVANILQQGTARCLPCNQCLRLCKTLFACVWLRGFRAWGRLLADPCHGNAASHSVFKDKAGLRLGLLCSLLLRARLLFSRLCRFLLLAFLLLRGCDLHKRELTSPHPAGSHAAFNYQSFKSTSQHAFQNCGFLTA